MSNIPPPSSPLPSSHERFGFVSLIGPTNAGKSTLLNRLVGAKVSIVSRKVQTTRTKIIGILTRGETQMAFVDTPGIFKAKKRLDKAMLDSAWNATKAMDMVVVLMDANKKITPNMLEILNYFTKNKTGITIALNKIDLCKKDQLLHICDELKTYDIVRDIFMLSALKDKGVDDLLNHIMAKMPFANWMYDPEQISDMPMRLFAAEITREAAYNYLHAELPYHLTVETESWDEGANLIRISQIIYVQNGNHKSIILGKGGQNIKRIGTASRQQLQEIMDKKIHLNLFVKLRPNWQDDPERYKIWDLNFNV